MKLFVSTLLASSCLLTFVWGQKPHPAPAPAPESAAPAKLLHAAERRNVLGILARELEQDVVFPDVATAYAAAMRKRLAGTAYEGVADPMELADRVTADLQAVSKDGHLRLMPAGAAGAGGPMMRPMPGGRGGPRVEALEEAKMIGEVAYLRFNLFPQDESVAARAREFLFTHADARAVIIDARLHRGGTLLVMDAILPLLYAKSTMLIRMDTRAAAAARGPLEDSPTLVRQTSPETKCGNRPSRAFTREVPVPPPLSRVT